MSHEGLPPRASVSRDSPWRIYAGGAYVDVFIGAVDRTCPYLLHVQIDEDNSGEISLWELFEALEMKQSKFTKRIFR